jgi:hypothetical protein
MHLAKCKRKPAGCEDGIRNGCEWHEFRRRHCGQFASDGPADEITREELLEDRQRLKDLEARLTGGSCPASFAAAFIAFYRRYLAGVTPNR